MLAALLGPVVGGALGPAAQAQQADPAAAPLVKVTDAKLPFAVSLPKGWVGLNLKDGLGGVTITSQAKPPAALMRLLLFPRTVKSSTSTANSRALNRRSRTAARR